MAPGILNFDWLYADQIEASRYALRVKVIGLEGKSRGKMLGPGLGGKYY